MAADDKQRKDEDKPRSGSSEPRKDSPAGKRPLSEDEKIDEALEESMDASDPPAHGSPSRVGAPPKRKTDKNSKPR